MPISDWLPASLVAAAAIRTVEADEALFRVDDRTHAVFDVIAGRIQLVRHDRGGRKLVLFAAGPGDSLAEPALFSPRYHCDAVAVERATVRVYPKARVLAALAADRSVALHCMAMLARQVQHLRARLQIRDIRSARERVRQHLALAAGPDGRTVALKGTLRDLAAELGLTPEALYRTLATLAADREIERHHGSIVLRRPPAT